MRNFTPLFLSLFMVLMANAVFAQQPVKDCSDIQVEIKKQNPTPGGTNGTIELSFKESIQNYKIFWVNAGRDKVGKVELKESKIENLNSGFYDFLIIDKTRKACVRQLTVTLD